VDWGVGWAAGRLAGLKPSTRGSLKAALQLLGAAILLLGGAASLGLVAVAVREVGAQVASQPRFWLVLLVPIPVWLVGGWLRAVGQRMPGIDG
jgi:hypothetical protein